MKYQQIPQASTRSAQDHIRAHRSTISWAAIAARALEESDPKTAVTFINLAASGATIDEGLFGPYPGRPEEELTKTLPPLEPQIKEMIDLTHGRSIDAVAISVGGNDVGFSSIVTALAVHGLTIGTVTYSDILEGFHTGDLPKLRSKLRIFQEDREIYERNFINSLLQSDLLLLPGIRMERVAGYNRLAGIDGRGPSLYSLLAERLRKAGVEDSSVYFALYPTPLWTWNDDSQKRLCREMLDFDLVRVDADEIAWANKNILGPLQDTIRGAARDNGWVLLDNTNIEAETQGRGLCSAPHQYSGNGAHWADNYPGNWFPSAEPKPSGLPSAVRWFRNPRESYRIQAGSNREGTTGTLHPNEYGHISMAQDFLRSFRSRHPHLWPKPQEE